MVHLKPVIGNQNSTSEKFLTMLVEIKSVLNSVINKLVHIPLLTEFEQLETPSHFLIGTITDQNQVI